MLVLISFVALVNYAAASNLDRFYLYRAGGVYAYDETKICRLLQENSEIFLQIEDIYSPEMSYPAKVMSETPECPSTPQLCFKADNFSFVLVKESCRNTTRVLHGKFLEFNFLLNYEMIRYDNIQRDLYILVKPELYICKLEALMEILKKDYTPAEIKCDRFIKLNVSSNWQDFVVADGLLFFMEDNLIYELMIERNIRSPPLLSSDFNKIPFVLFPYHNETKMVHWTVLWYLLEMAILIILVYLCKIQIRRTHSAVYIAPVGGPYKETVELVKRSGTI